MPAGDIKISSLKIGDLDLTNSKEATYIGFNIYEDILNPYGPMAEIRVLDYNDALGKNNIQGAYDKDVEISLSGADSGFSGGQKKFKLKMYQNKNLNDRSLHNVGNLKHKHYDIRAVSPELLNAQGNFMQKSYNDTTDNIVEDVVKKGFKTKLQIDKKSKTDGKRRVIINNKHPLEAIKHLNSLHVSQEDKSSCFVLFQETSNQQKYVFSTFEKLFKEKSSVTLKQTTTLDTSGTSDSDKQNSIIWFKASDSFFTPSRALTKSAQKTFNLTTHKVSSPDPEQSQKFKLPGQPEYSGQAQHANAVHHYTTFDKANDKEKHKTADARDSRANFLSYLSQNSAELETYFNPDIKLGSMIKIDIPARTADGSGKEKQFNGDVCVVAIRTKIKPLGQTPRATMILRVIKGGAFDQSGGGQP
jgi:hypothetical protein